MAPVFVDTSAIFAAVDGQAAAHEGVREAWDELAAERATFITTNYVVVESFALLQRRSGLSAAMDFALRLVPLLQVEWVDPQTHEAAMEATLTAGRRDLSLVDCVSFVVMRRLGIRQALTVDPHFREQGFECFPKESEQPA